VTIDLPADEVGRRGARDEADVAGGAAPGDPEAAAEVGANLDDASDGRPDPEPAVAPAAAAAAAPRRRLFGPLLAAALLGGAVGAVGSELLERTRALDGTAETDGAAETAAPAAPDPQLSAELADLRTQVAALRDAPPPPPPPPAADLAPLEAQVAALQQGLNEVRQQPAAAPDPAALQPLQERLARLEEQANAPPRPSPPPAPPRPDPALVARLDELAAAVADLRRAQDERPDPGPELARLSGAVDQVTQRLGALDDLGQRLQALEARPPVDLSGLENSVAELRRQLDDVSARLGATATEERVAGLDARLAEAEARAEQAATLGPAVAADALAGAVAAGTPFAAELAALRSLGGDPARLAPLEPHAETGLPTLSELRADFDAQVESLQPAAVPDSGGALDRLVASARGLVEVRPANAPVGGDAGQAIADISAALADRDLRAALAAWERLPQDAQQATADWAQAAQARLAADDLAAALRTEALARLGAGR